MVFNKRLLFIVTVTSVLWMPQTSIAGDEGRNLSLADVVSDVLSRHPDLKLNEVNVALSRVNLEKIQATLDPVVSGQVSVSQDQTPTSSDFQPLETRAAQFSGRLGKPLADGGEISLSADYNRTKQTFSPLLAAQLASVNPAYRGGVSLQYRMPLLRGEGRPEYHQEIAALNADILSVQLRKKMISRELTLRSLNTFFSVLSDQISIELANVAVDRALRLLEYQRFREKFGLIEIADRSQAEALLATRRLEAQQARSQLQSDQVSLNRLMLKDPDQPLQIVYQNDQPTVDMFSLEEVFQVAQKKRPEFEVLDAQYKAVDARLHKAFDDNRLRLDLIAELSSLSLDGHGEDAALDVLGMQDLVAGVALELSDTVGRKSANAAIHAAELQKDQIAVQRIQTSEQIRDEIAGLITTLKTGRTTLNLARERVSAEQRKFDAEMQRYKDGRSDTATIVQFEGDLYAAEIQAELQMLNLQLASKQLTWSKGMLLEELFAEHPLPYAEQP
ncbi:MAG: TolC family protein [Gammaproteobacteria bacterium]